MIPLVHVHKMVPLNVEGECDLFGACSENGTISCSRRVWSLWCMFRKWYRFMFKASVIPLVHIQKMVPLHVQGECDPFGACSENGTGPC